MVLMLMLNQQIPASLPPTPLSLLLSPSPPSSSLSKSTRTPNISFTKLLLLWELVLLGEPILVVSGNPREGGEVVEWLRSCIRPASQLFFLIPCFPPSLLQSTFPRPPAAALPNQSQSNVELIPFSFEQILFAGDYRPYFHLHDADFARLTSGSKVGSDGCLLRGPGADLLISRPLSSSLPTLPSRSHHQPPSSLRPLLTSSPSAPRPTLTSFDYISGLRRRAQA